MISKIRFVACLLLAATARLAAQTPASTNIDMLHTKITLQFDWDKKQAAGETTITLRFTRPVRSFALAADELQIKSVMTDDGHPLAFTYPSGAKSVDIQLPETRRTGDKLTFTVAYETRHHNDPDPNAPGGSFGKGIRFFSPTTVNPAKRKQAWSQGELQGNAYWFPCSHDMRDLRTTEFIATVERSLTVISNGKLVETTEIKDGKHTFHYKADTPYLNYLTAFAVGEYADLVQYIDGIPLHTYYYPDEKAATAATTERLPDMVRFLTEKTGVRYPFSEYAQVMVQDYPFPGLNGQHAFSIISDNMIDDYGTHRDFLFLWDGVEFNALSGQWFGNLLVPESVEDLWLAKSFSQYFEGLYTAEKNGMAEYLLWYLPWETGNIWGDWNAGNRHPIVTRQYADAEIFAGDSYAKYRGALVLRMLRKEIGDAYFFRSIQHFLQNNTFRPVNTRDFQASVQSVTGADPGWFFDQWIYRMGHPVFEVTDSFDARDKQYQLIIKQVQQSDSASSYPQTRYFEGRMEVEIDDSVKVIRLEARAENRFTFSMPAPPKLVNMDVENTWIREMRHTKTPGAWIYQLENSRDAQARSLAMTELVTIARSENATEAEKQQIFGAFRKVIQSWSYWRLRFNAIAQLRAIEPQPVGSATREMLLSLIRQERSWVKAAAITSLGATGDPQYADTYLSCLGDSSDRVINAAAIALGKTKSSKAFDALVRLKERPSWKNQSLLHALAGLTQLNDPRAEAVALAAITDKRSPRWYLGNGWDYPFVAAQTLAALGRTEQAWPVLAERFYTALKENCPDDMFYQALLIAVLGDPRGQEVFDVLKTRYKEDANAMIAVSALEEQFQAALIKKK